MSVLVGVWGQDLPSSYERDIVTMCSSVVDDTQPRRNVVERSANLRLCASSSQKVRDVSVHKESGVRCVVCGEIGPIDTLATSLPAARIMYHYRDDPTCSFLAELDGEFVILIEDEAEGRLHLACDRMGIGRLYTMTKGHELWFATVPSAFAGSPRVPLEIDSSRVREYLSLGYFLEDHSWLKGCRILPPGGLLTCDTRHKRQRLSRYWSLERLQSRKGDPVPLEEAARQTARLLRSAVGRRLAPQERATVTLSGGLDSRTILSLLLEFTHNIAAVTFGRGDCADVKLARRVARQAGVDHHVVEIGPDNWLQPRIAGVWRTGGELPLIHMHGIEAQPVLGSLGDANLNGFAGDLILGGSYLLPWALDAPVTLAHATSVTGSSESVLESSVDAASPFGKTDFYYLQNRVRRFTALGPAAFEGAVLDRKPFLDPHLLTYVYSLPDGMRLHNRLYRRLLLSQLPQAYSEIPWQKTGVPPAWPIPAQEAASYWRRVTRRIRRTIGRPSPPSFADYPGWLLAEPARTVVEWLLFHRGALYPDFCDPAPVRAAWTALLVGIDTSERVARFLTLELWLRQMLEARFRVWEELAAACPVRTQSRSSGSSRSEG